MHLPARLALPRHVAASRPNLLARVRHVRADRSLPLITPMRSDGSVADEKAYADFVDWQIKEGTDAVVPVGTTGEFTPRCRTTSTAGWVEIAIEVAKGRVPEIAGAGSNSTAEAIDLARHAKKAGADATLVVTPHCWAVSRRRKVMYLHFKAIADAARSAAGSSTTFCRGSVVDMSVETMARLAKHKNIIGVKDATANLVRPLHTKRLRGRFRQLSGEDHTAISFLAAGGDGCISVTANKCCASAVRGDAGCVGRRTREATRWRSRIGRCRCMTRCSPRPARRRVHGGDHFGKTSEHCRLRRWRRSWKRRGRKFVRR